MLYRRCCQSDTKAGWIDDYRLGFISETVRGLDATFPHLGSIHYRDNASVMQVPAVKIVHTGRPGPPRKVLSEPILREMFRPGRNINISQAARTLNVHRHTVKRYLQLYQIRKKEHSQLSDEELDVLVGEFKEKRPSTGLSYLQGHLLQRGWRIKRDRLLASISQVDGVQKALRKNSTIKRRKYVSSRPNAVWHMDGYHKLGPWGFIVHLSIDGCDSTVCFHPVMLSRDL